MKFAVRIHQGGWSYRDLEALWQEAERLGYDGASLYDLLGAPGPECWTSLTALTARTQRLVAIPLVLANPYRHPALVARMAAALHEASGGRLILGLGAGGSGADAEAFGIPWDETPSRVEWLEEAVRLMRVIWRGGGRFDGRWYRLDLDAGTVPPVAGDIPILVGGRGRRRLLPAAARVADLINAGFDMSPEEWRRLGALIDRHAQEAGRRPGAVGLTHNATVVMRRRRKEAASAVAELVARREDGRHRSAHLLAGTPEEIADRLRALEDAGVSWVFLLFQDLPDTTGLRLFAEAVLPRFR